MSFDNLRSDAARWGWTRSLFLRVITRLRRYAGIHIYRVGVRPLIRDALDPHLANGITLRIMRPEELFKAAGDPELELRPDFIRDALARGDIAFGAFEGERLVGYAWRTFTAVPAYDGLWARIDRPYHYIYNGFTRPSHRGKHIQIAIPLFSDGYFLDRGYTAEAGIVEITNFASLHTGKILGRRRIGYAGYLKWFGRCIPFRTPAVKKIGFQLFLKS